MNNEIVFRDFAVNGGWYCNVCKEPLHPDMVPTHKHREALPNPTTPRVNKPHAATPPDDPANPGEQKPPFRLHSKKDVNKPELYRDENGVYLYATKDQYGNLIPPHEHVYRCQDCGEIGSSPDAYERGWRDALVMKRAVKELEKGKPVDA